MTLWNDLKVGARRLAAERSFTLAAILVLALGIAATNTVFTLTNAVLLRDMPFRDPGRVVAIGEMSYLDARDMAARVRRFEGVGAFEERWTSVVDDGRPAERVRGGYVTANAFSLLGIPPQLGRDFRADDDVRGAQPVVMLSHALWERRYARQPGIVGQTVRVNGIAATVVGVMPPEVEFPINAKLWQPLAALPANEQVRALPVIDAFGRLRDGVTHAQANSDLAAVTATLDQEYPVEGRVQPRVGPLRGGIGGPIEQLMTVMMGAVVFVLLIACANVANLLLVRAVTRGREVSVRLAMGARRWHIVRQLLTENLLLAAVSGAVGLWLSAGALQLFRATVTSIGDPPPYWLHFTMDGQVFAALAFTCLGTAVVSGLVPALHTARMNIADILNEGGRGNTAHRGRRRLAGVLVVAQLALALVLMTGAGAMMRHLLTLTSQRAGIDTAGLVRIGIDLPPGVYATPEQRVAFYRQLEERLAALPGIRATMATAIPLTGAPQLRLLFEDREQPPEPARPVTTVVTVGDRYAETLGIRVLAGRALRPEDGAGGAVVNRRFAESHFGDGGAALGRRIRFGTGEEWRTIVGVVENVAQQRTESGDFDPVVYRPLAPEPPPRVAILLRAGSGSVTEAVAATRAQVAAIDPNLPLYDIRTVDEQLALNRWPNRVFGTMFVVFAVMALLLAAVGLYAVTAYAVAQRTQEIGVRMALGAEAREILLLVTRHASWHLAIGLALGGAGAVAVGRALPAFMAGSAGSNPTTIIAVAALLLAVGLLGCAIPARRATRLDPVDALRSD